jgi:hypothetical protein
MPYESREGLFMGVLCDSYSNGSSTNYIIGDLRMRSELGIVNEEYIGESVPKGMESLILIAQDSARKLNARDFVEMEDIHHMTNRMTHSTLGDF